MTAPLRLKLHPLCRIPLREPLVCQLPLDKSVVELPDERLVHVLLAAAEPADPERVAQRAAELLQLPLEEGRAVVSDLVENNLLVDADAPNPRADAAEEWIERGWTAGLRLHLETRELDYADADKSPEVNDVITDQLRETFAAEGKPQVYKEYPDAPATPLPPPAPAPPEDLEATLRRRRSNGAGRSERLTLPELSLLLHHGHAAVAWRRRETVRTLDEKPSNLLLYGSWSAVELYLAVFDVEGLAPGLYHYDVAGHRVVRLRDVSRRDIVEMCGGEEQAAPGPCTLLFSAVFQRYMYRYRHIRAYRNLLTNVAELAQRYVVLSTALRLGTYVNAAPRTDASERLLREPHFQEGLMYALSLR